MSWWSVGRTSSMSLTGEQVMANDKADANNGNPRSGRSEESIGFRPLLGHITTGQRVCSRPKISQRGWGNLFVFYVSCIVLSYSPIHHLARRTWPDSFVVNTNLTSLGQFSHLIYVSGKLFYGMMSHREISRDRGAWRGRKPLGISERGSDVFICW